MKLQVNGSRHHLSGSPTVKALLQQLGFGEKPVVVELNQRALFAREHADTVLHEGDLLEIVQITAGG